MGMNCDFQPIEGTTDYRCAREGCERIVRHVTQLPIFAPCRAPGYMSTADLTIEAAHQPPPIWAKAINFAKAVFHQLPLVAEAILTGDESKAFRSREEIEAIAATCKACPLFDGQVCTHPDCGCPIDEERTRWLSKLAYRASTCPDNQPRW